MATCPICKSTLECAHAADLQHQQAIEATKQDCPVTKGAIWVQVLDDKGAGVKDAKVKAAGKNGTTDDAGFAPFDPLDVETYDVELEGPLPDTHVEGFLIPPQDKAKVKAKVNAGEIVLVKFRLERINVVTPKLELEYKSVLFNRGLDAHQDGGEDKILPAATRIEVSVEQTNEAKYPLATTAKLVCDPANVDVFTDDKCTKALPDEIAADQLTADEPLSLWLRGKTKGNFKVSLELTDTGDPHIVPAKPAKQPKLDMWVGELVMEVHQHDVAAVKSTQVDPDQEPIASYHTALKDKDLPAQKALTDQQKVKDGRLLHAQIDGNHGRAKLVLKKLDATQWPADTDEYQVFIHATNTSGAVDVFDAETAGTKQASPAGPFKIKDLKAAEKVLWVEGKTSCKKLRDVRLDLALDRGEGDLAKEAKRNADWARFTVVKIKEVKLDHTPEVGKADPWDGTNNRWFINLKKAGAGRKLTIGATLEEPLENVVLHFMLVEHKDNRKLANWGVDLPTGAPSNPWVWKDITADVKHLDKEDRKNIVHVTAKTDSTGYAKKEVTLSQFGGDKFYLAAYSEQDPHLGKYIDGHGDLGTRKPIMRAEPIQVWRKFWYKELKVEGITVKDFGTTADVYVDVKTIMAEGGVKEMTRLAADALDPPVIYPKHMISYYQDSSGDWKNNFKGNTSDGLAVGDVHEAKFWRLAPDEADKPVMFRMLNADALFAPGGNTTAVNVNVWKTGDQFPIDVDVGAWAIDPPQTAGATLLTSGRYEAEELVETPPPSGSPSGTPSTFAWGNPTSGNLVAGDVGTNPDRDDPNLVQVKLPSGLGVVADPTKVRLKIKALVVRSSEEFLGTSYDDGIVNNYTPENEQDFINTIAHELGHSLKQVTTVRPAGIPAHAKQYNRQGSHCNYQNRSCLMYESGPQAICLNRYCPVCQPYVLVQDMSDV